MYGVVFFGNFQPLVIILTLVIILRWVILKVILFFYLRRKILVWFGLLRSYVFTTFKVTTGLLYQLLTVRAVGGFIFVLFATIATVFQLYHGGDMMYEMRRRKPAPTLLLTQ